MADTDPELLEALRLVAPGSPLRMGLDRIIQAKMGALIVVGDGPDVLAICSGGFLLDADFSAQRMSELAKMDGAIILAADASRIARANVHLLPDPSVPTQETGTRHRTAERVGRSVGVPVVSVSEEMSVITVYSGEHRYQLQTVGRLLDRATQTLLTLERYRSRFITVAAELGIHELDDEVTGREVAMVLQRSEMMLRLAEELTLIVVELGEEGRLVELQRGELLSGVQREQTLLLRDYLSSVTVRNKGLAGLRALDTEDLLDLEEVAISVGLGEGRQAKSRLTAQLRPKGCRLLARIPRLSDAVIDEVADHFGSLQVLLKASASAFTQVEGIGDVRARTIKEGLARVVDGIALEAHR
jgi:diadenylate cyclase